MQDGESLVILYCCIKRRWNKKNSTPLGHSNLEMVMRLGTVIETLRILLMENGLSLINIHLEQMLLIIV